VISGPVFYKQISEVVNNLQAELLALHLSLLKFVPGEHFIKVLGFLGSEGAYGHETDVTEASVVLKQLDDVEPGCAVHEHVSDELRQAKVPSLSSSSF
jgi:hypothetical protein